MDTALNSEQLIDSVQKAPGFLLWQVEMCWQRVVNKVLTDFDLTYTQFIVLCICSYQSKSNEQVYQHQVAKNSKIDRMMTSRILASLEKKGFVSRVKIDGDARAKLVTLTAQGKDVLERSLKKVTLAEANFFKLSDKNFVDSMDDILSDCENL
jgi:DNA-binding MarR family transcriptional regulator